MLSIYFYVSSCTGLPIARHSMFMALDEATNSSPGVFDLVPGSAG